MYNRTFKRFQLFILVQLFICFCLFNVNKCAPINSTVTFDKFLEDIKNNNCSFPDKLVLPFKSSTSTFEYLEKYPLSICKAPEASQRAREAVNLCSNIFDTLKNVTCDSYKHSQGAEIEFSEDVCADISSLTFPSVEDKHLLRHLTDKYVCDMLCDEEFKPACQVLLWSYEVQQKLESLSKIPEAGNSPEETDAGVQPQEQENPEEEKKHTVVKTENQDTSKKQSDSENLVTSNKQDTADKLANSEKNESNIEETSLKLTKANPAVPSKSSPITSNENTNIVANLENTIQNENKENEPIKEKSVNLNVGNEPENDNHVLNEVDTSTKDNVPSDVGKPSEPIKIKSHVLPSESNIINDENKEDQKGLLQKNPKTTVTKETLSTTQKAATTNDNPSSPNNTTITKNEKPVKIEDITADDTDKGLKEKGVKTVETHVTLPEQVSVEVDKQKAEVTEGIDIPPQKVDNENMLVTTGADLEKMEDENEVPESVNNDQDPYNDLENEGNNSNYYYDEDGFGVAPSSKKTEESDDVKIPVSVDNKDESSKYIYQQRTKNLPEPNLEQLYPAQEDGHFFFYFLTIIFVLMAGYLIFHNKQKIIALIVEGRHERRRRSHGVGYKKLETK